MDTLTVKIESELSKKVRIYCISNEIKLKDFVTDALIKEYILRNHEKEWLTYSRIKSGD